VDHVADIYHIHKSLPEVKRSVKCLEAGEKNLEFLPLDLILLLLLLHMQVEGGKEGRASIQELPGTEGVRVAVIAQFRIIA
jgi:hypothetical protein